jgi:hypothetical protein
MNHLSEDSMARSLPPKTANLSDSVHQQLKMYALAARAAGVGVLALAPPAEAKIVYTPAHRVIKLHNNYPIDLNHDGKTDFTIKNSIFCTDACHFNLFAIPVPDHRANGVIGYVKGTAPYYLASALKYGARVAPGGQFLDRNAGMIQAAACSTTFCFLSGQWENVQDRYLGLRFQVKGQTHYGWARLNVKVARPPDASITAILTGYAYETVPNKAIIAGRTKGLDAIGLESDATVDRPTPEPATLGLLALGSPGVSIWRREESLVAAR